MNTTRARSLLLLLLAGCAGGGEPDTCARVEDDCRRVAKANDFDADGVPENRSTWTYDDDGRVLVYEIFDGPDTLTWRIVSTWSGDLEATHTEDYGGDGVIDLSTTRTREPLADGGHRDTFVTTTPAEPTRSGWTEYDALGHAQRAEITTDLPEGPHTLTRSWTWDDAGHVTAYVQRLPPPERGATELFTYDDAGRLLSSETRFNDDNSTYRMITTAWEGCNPVRTVDFTDPPDRGTTSRTCTMSYDRDGLQTGKICFDEGDSTPLAVQTWTWSDAQHHQIAYDSDYDLQPDWFTRHTDNAYGHEVLEEEIDGDGVTVLSTTTSTWTCP